MRPQITSGRERRRDRATKARLVIVRVPRRRFGGCHPSRAPRTTASRPITGRTAPSAFPSTWNEIGKLNSNKPSDLQLYLLDESRGVPEGTEAPAQQHAIARRREEGLPVHGRTRRRLRVHRAVHLRRRLDQPAQSTNSAPQQRIIVDTTAPQVKISPSNNGVEWQATDDNLDPRGITLQCKWPSSREWTTVTDRAFRTSDRFAWKLEPGKVLEVRVMAKDRAGHESVSPVVRVPPDGASGAAFPRTSPGTGGPEWVGGPAPNLPARAYRLRQHAQVRRGLHDRPDGPLRREGGTPVRTEAPGRLVVSEAVPASASCPATRSKPLSLPYEAKEEGTYGFYVIPESGAGKRIDDPKRGDPAMLHVVVDTTPPYVQITGVQVRPAAPADRWSRSPGRRPTRT